jgi:hypothetical protein
VLNQIAAHGGLLVVALGLILISILGAFTRLLQSMQPQDISFNDEIPAAASLPLRVSSLPNSELQNLRRLLEREDNLQLAIFFASHQCNMDDVARIFESLRTPINPFLNLVDQLPEENIHNLYQSEAYQLLEDRQKSAIKTLEISTQRVISKEFIQQFGGIVFMENFIMYQHLSHTDSAYFHIPVGNELRRLFETFAQHGLAKTGKEIPVVDRIRGIDWGRLQMLAGKLGLNRFLHDRDDAIEQLSQKPRIEEIMDRDFPATDDFLLLKKSWDSTQVENEWQAYNAFAEILIKSQRSMANKDEKAKQVDNELAV